MEQVVLLKALQVTQDPKKLRQMMGVRTVTDVYRTLDKLSIRREYHDALARAGLSFDFIVGGIKDIAVSAEKDDTRLKAFQTVLKSLGLDKYENNEAQSGTWEEELLKALDGHEKKRDVDGIEEFPVYEVVEPELPESIRKIREEERKLVDGVYD